MFNTFDAQAFGVHGWPSGILLQLLRPDADDSISDWADETGGTTGIFNSIDEVSASDADYIRSPTPPNASVTRFRVSDPTAGKTLVDPVKIRYRFKKTSSDDLKLIVSLKQGTTLIRSWTHASIDLTETFQTVEQTLSSGELASITDFNNLFIELAAYPSASFSGRFTEKRGLAAQPPVVANIQTYSNVDFGDAGANRQAVVAWSYLPAAGGAVDLVSFKIDGITATRVDVANSSNGVAVYRAPLPNGSGPTHTLTLDFTGMQPPQSGFISCYAIYNSTSESHSSTTAMIYNPSATFDFPNYFVIVSAAADFNVSGATGTNLTLDHSETYAGIVQYAGASNFAASGNMTFTINWNASPNTASAAVFVAFTP